MRVDLIDYIESHYDIQDEISGKTLCNPLGAQADEVPADCE